MGKFRPGQANDDFLTEQELISGKSHYYADTGAADAYVITADPAITAYAAGQKFSFNASAVNTGASTLNVNAVGVVAIKKLHDQALAAGDIEAGQIVEVEHDGTYFQMMSQLATSSSASGDTLTKSVHQDTHGLAIGNVVKCTSGTYAKAQADSAANAEVIGVVSASSGADDFVVTVYGYMTKTTHGLSGPTVFLSGATAGLLTDTDPSIADATKISKPIARVVDTNTLLIVSERGMLGGASAAANSLSFVTVGSEATLSAERVLTAGTGILVTDGGAGATVTIATNHPQYHSQEYIISSGNFTVPTGVYNLLLSMAAGGGGGSGGAAGQSGTAATAGVGGGGGGAGQGGGTIIRFPYRCAPADVIAYVVGAAGTGGAGGATSTAIGIVGNNGGNSSFGFLTCHYGAGGRAHTAFQTGAMSGTEGGTYPSVSGGINFHSLNYGWAPYSGDTAMPTNASSTIPCSPGILPGLYGRDGGNGGNINTNGADAGGTTTPSHYYLHADASGTGGTSGSIVSGYAGGGGGGSSSGSPSSNFGKGLNGANGGNGGNAVNPGTGQAGFPGANGADAITSAYGIGGPGGGGGGGGGRGNLGGGAFGAGGAGGDGGPGYLLIEWWI